MSRSDRAVDLDAAIEGLRAVITRAQQALNYVDGRDARDESDPDYNPRLALGECYDLWASGAWPDANSLANLEEVMGHVESLVKEPSRGCSCGEADYGTPGHDGGPEIPVEG